MLMRVLPIHLLHKWVPLDVQIMIGYGSHLLWTSRQTFKLELKNITHKRRILYYYVYMYESNSLSKSRLPCQCSTWKGQVLSMHCALINVICEYKLHLPLASRLPMLSSAWNLHVRPMHCNHYCVLVWPTM